MSPEVDAPETDAPETDAIAVIGLACRYPGARDAEGFWRNLAAGVDAVTRGAPRPVPGGRGEYVPARGVLEEPEWIDAGYFGLSPREARLLNPQHRLFLECATTALDDAGHDPHRHDGAIGVFAGGTDTAYGHLVRAAAGKAATVSDWELLIANAPDFMPSRVAYKLGLRGPAVAVQAACATSLVAVHTAVAALLAGDCDIALAGGAAVHVPGRESPFTEGGIIARDGVCRTFDAGAGGTVGGDGVGVVVLRRLVDALADGDHVRAVLRGTAVNNDGRDRVGFTAPGVEGQRAVIRAAQALAGVDADEIGYVEAHGTATPLGDPIELTALTTAFREDTDRVGYCGIGSVKTGIGHTDAAAGAAGLIKTVLAVENGLIPPSLHFTEPNPRLDLAASPFRVVTEPTPWRAPRLAGVSAFGIGGTNAHVVVGEAPADERALPAAGWYVLPLSARTPAALDAATARLAEHLRTHPGLRIDDVAFTLQVGRTEHAVRRFALVRDLADAVDVLTGGDPTRLVSAADSATTVPAGAGAEHRTALRWLGGDTMSWRERGRDGARRVPLPAYPFERAPYLAEGVVVGAPVAEAPVAEAPVADGPVTEVSAAATAPTQDATEDVLTVVRRLFAETLDLPDVEPEDDFFDLGGDSLVAVDLVGRLGDRYRIEIDSDVLYDAPTPVGLAALVAAS